MGFRANSKVFILLVFAFSLAWSSLGVGGETSISEEEDAELERQLKIINKPAIKVIKTDYGDIYDCVDVNKQPAFDHPLLKNHKIQMRPTSIPSGISDKASSMEEPSTIRPSKIGLKRGCPLGTVPIRRTQKEDLIRVKSIPKKDPTNIEPQTDSAPGHHVNPGLYGDNLTRLYTSWTADGYDKTGCFNILCAGFVHISTTTALGLAFDLSVIDGIQYETHMVIYQDMLTGNWWLSVQDDAHVGYWPKSLFTNLASFASVVQWGSEVYGPPGEASPPMGSGRLPSEGLYRACFFRMLQVIYESDLVDLEETASLRMPIDHPNCYSSDMIKWSSNVMKYFFFVGGPGGMGCGV
ncbi:hypothetical protein HHK36_013655 [Tetracentron sinense]|uniref:Neprosin PEP catalytic domain-containing protein n=1 Tax=Tetracentron sinense TaxID=13715 RepID=A0A834Z8L1_TETSI|nr:hypothetical protein HHK36_013648 [Tetracentron sinense]KAF8400358.1 hypothetical protein HHK36_013655 [Tetracentron sinense]